MEDETQGPMQAPGVSAQCPECGALLHANGGVSKAVYDQDGRVYASVRPLRLLNAIDAHVAQSAEDGGHAVIEPDSGAVLGRGDTPDQAAADAQGIAMRLGRRRLQAAIDARAATEGLPNVPDGSAAIAFGSQAAAGLEAAPPEWGLWNPEARRTYADLVRSGTHREEARDAAWRVHMVGLPQQAAATFVPYDDSRDDTPPQVKALDADAIHDYAILRHRGWNNSDAERAVSPYDEAAADMPAAIVAAGGSAVNDYLVLRRKGWSDADATNAVMGGPDDVERPVGASARKRQVEYSYADGSATVRTGGSPSWRTHNPGNMVAGAAEYVPIGRSATGKFAVFPDEETGFNAAVANLYSPAYQKLTVLQAIKTWAPKKDRNNPAAYARTVSNWTGLDVNTPLSTLTPAQIVAVANAIQRFEGSKAGTTTDLPSRARPSQ